jgi:hypothetical protein
MKLKNQEFFMVKRPHPSHHMVSGGDPKARLEYALTIKLLIIISID